VIPYKVELQWGLYNWSMNKSQGKGVGGATLGNKDKVWKKKKKHLWKKALFIS
jgi:hypothetical protein